MVRTIDHETRRKAVLTATINKFIREASPVSSEDIAKEFNLSPATIRNIFAELEDANYLTHPYTSGGRIPTKKGYRYYVDFLISQFNLIEEEKEQINKEYRNKTCRLEDLLDKTSEIISSITHNTGIALFSEWRDKFFYRGISQILRQPEFHDYQRIRHLIKLIEEKQYLIRIIKRDFRGRVKVYIGEELECPEIENCAIVVSNYRLKDNSCGRIAVLGPMRMEYGHIISAVEYISGALSNSLSSQL